MNATQLHLLVNHFPIIGSIFALLLLFIGMLFHQKQIKMIALSLCIFNALACIPSMMSGERSEHAVEEQPGVARYMIEEHEELAEQTAYVLDAIAVVALISLVLLYKNNPFSKWMVRLSLILLALSIYFVMMVGHSGGQIRRPDLRSSQESQ